MGFSGEAVQLGLSRRAPGQPPLPTRLAVWLYIYKHMFNLSEDALCVCVPPCTGALRTGIVVTPPAPHRRGEQFWMLRDRGAKILLLDAAAADPLSILPVLRRCAGSRSMAPIPLSRSTLAATGRQLPHAVEVLVNWASRSIIHRGRRTSRPRRDSGLARSARRSNGPSAVQPVPLLRRLAWRTCRPEERLRIQARHLCREAPHRDNGTF